MNTITASSPDSTAVAQVRPESPERLQLSQQLRGALLDQLLPSLARLAAAHPSEAPLRESLRHEADQHCHPPPGMFSDAERQAIIERAVDDALGYGPLEALWRDETIGEITLNGPGEAYVVRHGRLQWIDPPVSDEESLRLLARRLFARAGLAPPTEPVAEARLPDGASLTVIGWPHAAHGTLVSLRRSAWRSISTQDLIQSGCAAPEMLTFLAACVQARLNIVISGPPNSGATSLLGVLARSFGREERVVTVEDTAELRLQQPHWVALEAGAGRSAALDSQLLATALRMRPDRLVVGECRGAETATLVQAMAGGLDGVLTTVHAHTPREALGRLESLALRAEPQTPPRLIRQDLAAGVQIVVQLGWLRGALRRITAITEVAACEGESMVTHDLFHFEQPDARSAGQFVCCGNRPHNARRLADAGVALPTEFFERRSLDTRRPRG